MIRTIDERCDRAVAPHNVQSGSEREGTKEDRINHRAFTLIEIILVIFILAVILGLSIPNLTKSYYKIILNQTVNDIVYLMRYAQSRAIIQRNVFQFVLNPDQKHYYLEEKIPEEEIIDIKNGFRAIPGRLGKIFSIPADIAIVTQPSSVQFQPNGKIDKVSYTLCCKKKCRTISTKEQSGYVSVFDDSESRRGSPD